jgi:NDP-sugar pyrophosphorylase family protein/flavin reductase (DIM6/NTAB) family NADH-FMN oxidoreductase RutF
MEDLGLRAVILAGGRGTRLAPYTSVLPKPLMPVGDRAILELVVEQLADCGIHDVTFCVGYLSHLIRAVFDNQHNGRVPIRYVQEDAALGTAGPLRLVEGLDDTFIAMNGDVLTNLDYGDLVRYHREQGNMLTIATRDRSIKIDYGVLHLEESGHERITGYHEKPQIVSTVSMGIYVIEPEALRYVPEGVPFDIPDLVQALLADGHPLGAYRYDGLWFDIGREEDYQQAVSAWFDQGAAAQAPAAADVVTLDAIGVSANGNGHGHAANGNGHGHLNGNGHVNGHGHAANGNGHGHLNGNGHVNTNGTSHVNGNGNGHVNGNGNGNGHHQDPVMQEDLRETLSRVPSAVTIVTTSVEGRAHGTTVSSFTSLSAEPPLITIALKRSSDLLGMLEASGKFVVNLLTAGQEELGRLCAQKGEDKLADVALDEADGLPRIHGAAGWLSCDVREFLEGGDHVIVVGEVTSSEAVDGAAPLVYHRRRFLELAP